MTGDLTTDKHWDDQWRATRSSRIKSLLSPVDSEVQRFLRKAFANVPQEGRLLELGGAPGSMLLRQRQARPDLTLDCLDYSSVGVEETQELYKAAKVNGSVYQGDIRKWHEGEASYDVVTSFGLIEHFNDYDDLIKEHFRFCKPGGLVVLTVPNYSSFPVKTLLGWFSKETLATHNLDCMSAAALRAAADDQSDKILTGGFGSARLPHSQYDATLGGKFYHQASKFWNAGMGLLTALFARKIELRFWPNNYYLIARRPEAKS